MNSMMNTVEAASAAIAETIGYQPIKLESLAGGDLVLASCQYDVDMPLMNELASLIQDSNPDLQVMVKGCAAIVFSAVGPLDVELSTLVTDEAPATDAGGADEDVSGDVDEIAAFFEEEIAAERKKPKKRKKISAKDAAPDPIVEVEDEESEEEPVVNPGSDDGEPAEAEQPEEAEDEPAEDRPTKPGSLRVLHDKRGVSIALRLFGHYVEAESDYRAVAHFLRDLDTVLAKYRSAVGNTPVRKLTEIDPTVDDKPNDDSTALAKAKNVSAKRKEDETRLRKVKPSRVLASAEETPANAESPNEGETVIDES